MPGTTTTYAIPFPVLTDPADMFTDGVKDTADFIDSLLTSFVRAGTTPPAVGVPAQQAWQAITLTGFNSGDANGDGQPDNVVHYYKDSLGIVHFSGEFTVAASPSVASTICTLPAGYRPGFAGVPVYLPLVLAIASGGSATVAVRSDGTIKVVSALNTNAWSWASVSFRAEN